MTLKRLALLAALVAASGCATPPDYFHTLRPLNSPGPSAPRAAPRLLSIGPVTVPEELGRDEWVIRTGATGARVYDHQLWTQGLAADVAQSLADYLNLSLMPEELWADAGPSGSGTGADLEHPAPLRLRVQVLRLDSILAPKPAVTDQIRWTLECLPADASQGPVEAGRYREIRSAVYHAAWPAPEPDVGVEAPQQPFDQIASAHSRALGDLAREVSTALRASAAERARACIGPH